MKNIREKRSTTSTHSIRAITLTGDSQGRFIEGYASVFNTPSKLIYEYRKGELQEFYEVIEPTAFNELLQSSRLNVVHTINHDPKSLCARTKSGTLQLSVDETGLKYRFKVNDGVTYIEDLYKLIESGDYYESSFVFTVDEADERWEERDGQSYRYISKFSGLYDTSTVTDGAYANTLVLARGTEAPKNLSDYSNIVITSKNLDEVFDARTIDIDFEFSQRRKKTF